MKERMQKTSAQAHDFPQRARTESEWYEGVQTFMWMTEDNIVEVPFDKEHLLEIILSPSNLNKAYKAVVRNNGSGGIDKMSCEQLLPWLKANKDELIISLQSGTYRPNPVRRVEIPKDNGKTRPLGIPSIWDRLIQQCILQILEPICEAKFHERNNGFRPYRSTQNAIAQCYKMAQLQNLHFVVDVDIVGFFDNIDHSKLIQQLWGLGVQDRKLIMIIKQMLKAEILFNDIVITPETGTPQGGFYPHFLQM